MQARIELATQDDLRMIHDNAKRVLEEVGGRIMTEEARDLLLAHGGTLEEEDLVKIPGHLVEEALEAAPGAFTLYDRRGEPAIELMSGRTYVGAGVTNLNYLDPRDDTVKDFNLTFTAEAATLADALGDIGPLVTYDLLTRDTVTSARGPNKQWPGTTGDVGDPLVDQLVAAANSTPRNGQLAQDLWKRYGAQLIDRVGPCVMLTHSAGGPFGWLVANERPNLVKALASFEGATAPLVGQGGAAGTPLPGLKNMPVMYLLSERGGRPGGPILEALTASGAKAEVIDLKQRGILGNSHFAMFENNRRQVFEVIRGWIEKAAPSPTSR